MVFMGKIENGFCVLVSQRFAYNRASCFPRLRVIDRNSVCSVQFQIFVKFMPMIWGIQFSRKAMHDSAESSEPTGIPKILMLPLLFRSSRLAACLFRLLVMSRRDFISLLA